MSNPCAARLQKELRDITKNPLPGLRALPSPSNLLEWHYVLEGAADSDYAGGYYHGKITFPSTYPFKPPSIQMLTPSGRFEPGAKICLSMSDFHPESWNPMWGVGLILLGIQSFFYENTTTTGAMHNVPTAEKRRLAAASLTHCIRNPNFRKLFPELVQLQEQKARDAAAAAAAAATAAATASATPKSAAAAAALPGQVPAARPAAAARVAAAPTAPAAAGAVDLEVQWLGWRQLLLGAAMVVAAAVGVAAVLAVEDWPLRH